VVGGARAGTSKSWHVVRVRVALVALQLHRRTEDCEALLQALRLAAWEVLLMEVLLVGGLRLVSELSRGCEGSARSSSNASTAYACYASTLDGSAASPFATSPL
jgi:hypothetical protein